MRVVKLRAGLLMSFGCALAACVVDVPSSAEGKPCPCPAEGYVCRDDVCVADGAATAGGESCLVTATDFRPKWSTPETIRWDWTNKGRAEDFVGYAVVIGGSEEDVRSGSGTARVIDGTVNPELAFYIAPHEGGPFPVVYTITDGLDPLEPSTPGRGRYFAQLQITDVGGCVFKSDVAQATTKLPPIDEVVIFDEEWSGELYGNAAEVVDGCGVDGGNCIQCSAANACLLDSWDELKPITTIDLSSIPENAFATGQAYFEAHIAIVSTTPSYYTELMLVRRATDGSESFWGLRRLPLRAQTPDVVYQTVQLPLNGMTVDDNDGPPLTYGEIQTAFDEVYLGSELIDASEVRVDDIAVRW